MKRSAVKPLRFAVLAPLVMCVALAAGAANAALPTGYTQYTYIQGDGSSGRIVMDDYTPTPNYDKIEAVVSFPSGTLDQYQCIWCSRGKSATTLTWTLFIIPDGSDYKFRFDYGTNAGNNLTPALSDSDEKYTVTADGPAFSSSGGQTQTHTKTFDYTAGSTLMLFASRLNNKGTISSLTNYGKHKLYSFKIWRSEVLIHDLVPAQDSGSVKGLYDVVTDTFYAGTGSFTMGEEVVSLSDTLDITASTDGIGLPSPSYGVTNGLAVSDSFIVSCGTTPVANADNTAAYVCTGWKLYDETNVVVSTGSETSFTYVHPAEYRRLEWQWEATACRGTIAAGHGGAVSQSGTGWYTVGTPVTVTATPNAGNGFQRWAGTLPEGISATSATVTFTPTAPFSMTAVFETIGSGGFVFIDEKPNSYWHTATNSTMTLPIEFPAGASSATLSVTAPGYSVQYAIPSGTTQYTLSLPAATSPTAENVYDLSLAFNDSASTVRTAKLGLIYGYNTTTTGWTRCIAPAGTKAWSKTKGVAVIPIPYNTTSFTIALNGGTATETDTGLAGAAGWYPLRLKGSATAELAAETSEGDFVANLMGDGAGFFLIVR